MPRGVQLSRGCGGALHAEPRQSLKIGRLGARPLRRLERLQANARLGKAEVAHDRLPGSMVLSLAALGSGWLRKLFRHGARLGLTGSYLGFSTSRGRVVVDRFSGVCTAVADY